MKQPISIKKDTCNSCGLCVEICPNRIMTRDDVDGISLRTDRLALCIKCGQCMAVCPSQAIVLDDLVYERDFFALPKRSAEDMTFLEMIKTRRAVRVFKNQPVPKELLEKVVEAITFAPPGFTPLKTELTVVQDTAVIRRALPEMIKVYDSLVKAMNNPIARFLIRHRVGVETFKSLKGHVVPLMESRLPELKQGTEDTITRYAPAMIIFHAHRDAENYEEDIYIALTYGFLAAHALGLGGSAMSLIPPPIQRSHVLRKLFSIPDTNVVVGSIILGYPKYRYQWGIKRNLKSVTWI